MEKVHDCQILEFDNSEYEVIPCATFPNPEDIDLERWHKDMSPNSHGMRAFARSF